MIVGRMTGKISGTVLCCIVFLVEPEQVQV